MFTIGFSVALAMLLGLLAAGPLGGAFGILVGFAGGGLVAGNVLEKQPTAPPQVHPDTAAETGPRHAHCTAA